MSTIGHVRLARFLGRFEKENPGLELAVTEASVAELKDGLADGELDLAVMSWSEGLQDAFRAEELYRERYVVVFPPEHRLGALNAVRLEELSGQPYVDRLACEMREMVMGVCGDRGVSLYARFRSEREDWVQAMVLAGIGFAFMPEYSVTLPGLLQRPLVEPEVERRVMLAHAPGRPHPPAVAALLSAARRFAWPG
jgi:DNA-binding transcriptional LysR family regulator